MKKIYKRKSLRRLVAAVCGALVAGTLGFAPVLYANPILDSKDAAVSISGLNTSDMSINSTATNNVIKWVDFSIGSGEKVAFDTNNYLNYVTGSARSDIYGIMKGTGNIYLVNPNGILIGDTARIDVGNLYLSTRNLTDDQLAAFTTNGTDPVVGSGTLTGDVINLGQLDANTVTVEGNNITFKNVAEVTKGATLGNDGKLTGGAVNTNVTMTASDTGEIHLGVAVGPEATSVNDEQYKNVSLSIPTGWEVNKTADEAMYMLVRNKYELQNMQNKLDGNYMLSGDIEMNGVNFTPLGYRYDGPPSSNPEDREDAHAFSGRFDGLGYEVKNLSINYNHESSIDEYGNPGLFKFGIGLFGYNKGTVENVTISGGSIKSKQRCVGIIGINSGMVRNVFNDGVRIEGREDVGGIVGQNEGTITNVWNTGTVSGDETVGGIAGISCSGGSIANAYNAGSVSGSSATFAGGIVGNNLSGNVLNVYNTGTVSGYSYTGGIAGINTGNIQYSYNTGTVKSSQYNPAIGGIAGDNRGTIENAYSKTTPVGNGSGGTEVAEADMKKAATFTGFDFSEGGAWRIYEGQTLPLLTAFMTRKDNVSTTTYNGGANVGATYTDVTTPETFSAENAQFGSNYIKNVSIVTPANVTFTVDNYTRDYDGTTSAEGATLSVASGQIFTKDSYSGGTFTLDSKNAGVRTITVSNVTIDDGNGGRNYNVTYQNGTGTITPKEVTATVADTSKVYDGTTNATANGNLTGVIAGDTLTVTATGNYDDKNVGTGKTVNYTGFALSGSEAGNYNLTTTAATGTGTITRKALSLVATPQTITEGEATPTFTGSVTGFVTGEGLGANDTLSFALDNPEAAAVGSYKVTGTLSIDGAAPLTSGDYGDNYTFANAAANATAFTIAAKYVPPAPTPTPSAPSGGNGGNTGNTGGNTGSTTPTNPTTPTELTPIAPSGNTDGTTPNSGGNTSGTGANTPAPLAAAERVIVAAVTETETIAAAATAGATAEMTHIADNVRPTSLTEQPANSGENAAAAPLAAAVETAANAQGFTLTAGGILAISNENNSAPKDAMSVESIGHALSTLQHGSGEKSAATAPNTEMKSAAGSIGSLEEAVEATDLAIGTEIAETDRESGAGQENLASDTSTAGGADESAEESDEKKKR